MSLGGNCLFEFETSGKSVQLYDMYETVRKKLKFLLEAKRGETFSNLNYGADLVYFVFAPTGEKFEGLLIQAVKTAVAEFMPYINIKNIVNIVREQGYLGFSIEYSLDESYTSSVDINLTL